MAVRKINKDPRNPVPEQVDERSVQPKREQIGLLPVINQTDALKKFFGATIDHLFEPNRSRKVSGFIGEKTFFWEPTREFYLSEETKPREYYQLAPILTSRDIDNNLTNSLFYEDILNHLRFQGGIVNDHNRLFEQEYYSWAPPIDLDKFASFSNYFWLDQGPNPIVVDSPTDIQNYIIGQVTATVTVDGNTIDLTSGLRITITDDANALTNGKTYGVEGVGRGIRLLEVTDEGSFSGWDEDGWDASLWDILASDNDQEPGPEYFLIERGSIEGSPWSTGNHWYHRDVIEISNTVIEEDPSSLQAKRPIIEFIRDLEVFNYGVPSYTADVVYTESINFFGALNGKTIWFPGSQLDNPNNIIGKAYGQYGIAGHIVDGVTQAITVDGTNEFNGIAISDGLKILVTSDINPAVNNRIYEVSGIKTTGIIELTLVKDLAVSDDVYRIRYGNTFGGTVVEFDGTNWNPGIRKLGKNDPPKFQLYDIDNVKLNDVGVYPGSDFQGSTIFTYKENQSPFQPVDPNVGLKLSFNNTGEIVFENTLATERFSSDFGETIGYYFFRQIGDTVEDDLYSNSWNLINNKTKQYIIDVFEASKFPTSEFPLTQEPAANVPGDVPNLIVQAAGRQLDESEFSISGNILSITPSVGTLEPVVRVRSHNPDFRPTNEDVANYEIPLNLVANPNNEDIQEVSQTEFFNHFREIIENQEDFQGTAYGLNNWRDTTQDLSFGRSIMQHQAPMLKLMLLASDDNLDYMKAVRFVEREYTRFRNKFVSKVDQMLRTGQLTSLSPTQMVNEAIIQINVGKTNTFPFYYSGMISEGSLIPATPSFLGVFPVYEPEVFLDTTLPNPQPVLRGHDGSLYYLISESTTLPTNNPLDLVDPRDQAQLQYENMVYASVDTKYTSENVRDFNIDEFVPNYFRETDYTPDEVSTLFRPMFERWAILNNADYRENVIATAGEPFTYNYKGLQTFNGKPVPGYWRGMYRFVYGTERPDLYPWEMLGFDKKPSYWDAEYGPSPYTSGNSSLWTDIENGEIKDGIRKGIDPIYARPGLSNILPVDASGTLLNPVSAGIVLSTPTIDNASRPWEFGDGGPIESVWRNSESYPFAVAQVGYLIKPARFIEFAWDPARYDEIFVGTTREQWVNTITKNRPQNSELNVHGEVVNNVRYIGSGIQQWISDRVVSQGQDITTNFGDILRGIDVQLGHKMGGYTETENITVVADNFGLVPQEDTPIELYSSASLQEFVYSGVIITWNGKGWQVFGYDSLNPLFKTLPHDPNGRKVSIRVGEPDPEPRPRWETNTSYAVGIIIQYQASIFECTIAHQSTENFERGNWRFIGSPVANNAVVVTEYTDGILDAQPELIPYGTQFTSKQDVYQFLINYERYLKTEGWIFDKFNEDTNTINNWRQSGKEFLFWTLTKWAEGNFIALSPLSDIVKFRTPQGVTQNIETLVNGSYPLLNKTGQRIEPQDTTVVRSEDTMTVTPNAGIGIFLCRTFVKEFEHILLLSNTTAFNDLIYDPVFNVRQQRLKLNTVITDNWTGRLDAAGFIVQADNIYENFDKTVTDFEHYFDIEDSVDRVTLREHARHITGYQVRDYFRQLLIDPDTSFQFYQGMIQAKGTRLSLDKFLKAATGQNNQIFTVFEEFAVRIGRFGGTEIRPSIEFQMFKEDHKTNPQLIEFGTGFDTDDFPFDDVLQIDDSSPRWQRKPADFNNVWELRTSYLDQKGDYRSAGYVNLADIDYTAFDRSVLNDTYFNAIDNGNPIEPGDHIWVYQDFADEFQVYQVIDTSSQIETVTDGDQAIIKVDNDLEFMVAGSLFIIDNDTSNETGNSLQGIIEVVSINDPTEFTVSTIASAPFDYTALPIDTDVIVPTLLQLIPVRFPSKTVFDVDPAVNAPIGLTKAWIDDISNGADDEPHWVVVDIDADTIEREQELRVANRRITNSVLYNAHTNRVKNRFNVNDPRKGLVPGVADEEIYYHIDYDPAIYTDGDPELDTINEKLAWGDAAVARLWWDTSKSLYLDYEQGSREYRRQNWGKLAPGAEIKIYEWTKSPVEPLSYQTVIDQPKIDSEGTYSGTVKDPDNPSWVEKQEFDQAIGDFKTVFFFWVEDTDQTPAYDFRSINAIQVRQILENPTSAGILWFSPIATNALIYSNSGPLLEDIDSVVQVNWEISDPDINIHQEWQLLREDDPSSLIPNDIWIKMRDSIVGFDGISSDNLVPDPLLTETERYGTFIRPRQTWFRNLTKARTVFVDEVNRLLTAEPILLNRITADDNLFYVTPLPTTGFDYQVVDNAERDALIATIAIGEIVLVEATTENNNRWTRWEYTAVNTFTLIETQEVRLEDVWDYADYRGTELNNVSDTFTPTVVYADRIAFDNALAIDSVPLNTIVEITTDTNGKETWLIVADDGLKTTTTVFAEDVTFQLNDTFLAPEYQIFTNNLRNDILTPQEQNHLVFVMINFVHSEQNMVDWAFKTSYIIIRGLEEELKQTPILREDITQSIIEYIEEAKPYHTKIRDFRQDLVIPYDSNIDEALLHATDFDKPVYFDGTNFRVLDENIAEDFEVIQENSPWNEWYADLEEDGSYQRVRRLNSKIVFDRVKCTTNIPQSGTQVSKITLLSSALQIPTIGSFDLNQLTVKHNMVSVLNSRIISRVVRLTINEPVTSSYVGDFSTRRFAMPKQIVQLETLTVVLNGITIFKNGSQLSTNPDHRFAVTTDGLDILFNNAPATGLDLDITIDERFTDNDGNLTGAFVFIGTDQNPGDILNVKTLDFTGTADFDINKLTNFDTNINVSFGSKGAVHGVVDVEFEYIVTVDTFKFTSAEGLDAADRVALFYNAIDSEPQQLLTPLETKKRIKGEGFFGTDLVYNEIIRPEFRVNPIPGCDFRGTLVYGVSDPKWLEKITQTALPQQIIAAANINLRSEVMNASIKFGDNLLNLGLTYEDLTPGDGFAVTLTSAVNDFNGEEPLDIPIGTFVEDDVIYWNGIIDGDGDNGWLKLVNGNLGGVIQPFNTSAIAPIMNTEIDIDVIMNPDSNDFSELSPNQHNIVTDGTGFHRPYFASDHPEELVKVNVDSSVDIKVFYDGVPGSPIILVDRLRSNGTQKRYGLLQIPQSNAGIFVYADGVKLDQGDDYVVDWTTNEIVFEDTGGTPTIPVEGVILKISTFSHGGNRVAFSTVFEGGTDTFQLRTFFVKSSTLVFVDGEPLDPVDYVVFGDELSITTGPVPTDTRVFVVVYDTGVSETIEDNDPFTDTYVLDNPTGITEGQILVTVDSVPEPFTYTSLTGEVTLLTGIPTPGSSVRITVFNQISPSLVRTIVFAGDGTTPDTVVNGDSSLTVTLPIEQENSMPSHANMLVREDGLRLRPDRTFYQTLIPDQYLLVLDTEVDTTNGEVISLIRDGVEQTENVDYVNPSTRRGTLDTSVSMVQALSDIGLTVGDLNPGDYFTVTNLANTVITNDFQGGWGNEFSILPPDIESHVDVYDPTDLFTQSELLVEDCDDGLDGEFSYDPTTDIDSGRVYGLTTYLNRRDGIESGFSVATPTNAFNIVPVSFEEGQGILYIGNNTFSVLAADKFYRPETMDASITIADNLTNLGLTYDDLLIGDTFKVTTTVIDNFFGSLPLGSFIDGDVLYWNGPADGIDADGWRKTQNPLVPEREIHFVNPSAEENDIVFWLNDVDREYDADSTTVTILNPNPASEYQVTFFSIDDSLNIETHVYDESRDGIYQINNLPFDDSYIWFSVNGERKLYQRDYLITSAGTGWDTTPWDAGGDDDRREPVSNEGIIISDIIEVIEQYDFGIVSVVDDSEEDMEDGGGLFDEAQFDEFGNPSPTICDITYKEIQEVTKDNRGKLIPFPGSDGWDTVTSSSIIRTNPFVGTTADWLAKSKDDIVATIISGPPIQTPFAYRVFTGALGSKQFSRIADFFKLFVREEFTSTDVILKADVNPTFLESEFPIDYVYEPTASAPGVLYIGTERLEYSNVNGPLFDNTTGKRFYEFSGLNRATRLISPSPSYGIGTVIERAGPLEQISHVYEEVSPDPLISLGAEAILAESSSIDKIADGNTFVYALDIYPVERTITSVYLVDQSGSTEVLTPLINETDNKIYTINNITNVDNIILGSQIEFDVAPVADALRIIQVIPESLNLLNKQTRQINFLRKEAGTLD